MKQYQDNKFDVIVDCIGGGNFHDRATNVLKAGREGGVFVAVTGDDTNPDCRTVWKVIRFFLNLAWLPLYASFRGHLLPKYVLIMPHNIPQCRAQVLQWMAEGQLKIPLEPEYEFTEAGVRAAFAKVGTGHAHGKVVITM